MNPTSSNSPAMVHVPEAELSKLVHRALARMGLSDAHVQAIAKVIVAGQRDACQSHGVYRLISCVDAVRAGKVQLEVEPVVTASGGPIVQVDAKYGFSPLAFERGLPTLVEATRRHGLGALVIRHCFHFSALWPEIEAITAHGLAALALTPSHAWVAPAGGSKPLGKPTCTGHSHGGAGCPVNRAARRSSGYDNGGYWRSGCILCRNRLYKRLT